jgi:hypothetical protein
MDGREMTSADCVIVDEETGAKLATQVAKFLAYAPHYTGQSLPVDSVKDVLSVVEKSSLKNGNGGTYVSHFGNKQWL